MSTTLTLVDLRSGGPRDLPLIDSIMQSAFDPRYGEAWTRAQCMGILAMPGVWLTVATIDGTACGFSLSRLTVDETELLLLATVPAYRRRGVGGALLRSVISRSKDLGARRVHLEVRSGNEAMNLYRATGFSRVGERRGYYRGAQGNVFDAVTFALEIV